jgi:hypothetical protein
MSSKGSRRGARGENELTHLIHWAEQADFHNIAGALRYATGLPGPVQGDSRAALAELREALAVATAPDASRLLCARLRCYIRAGAASRGTPRRFRRYAPLRWVSSPIRYRAVRLGDRSAMTTGLALAGRTVKSRIRRSIFSAPSRLCHTDPLGTTLPRDATLKMLCLVTSFSKSLPSQNLTLRVLEARGARFRFGFAGQVSAQNTCAPMVLFEASDTRCRLRGQPSAFQKSGSDVL